MNSQTFIVQPFVASHSEISLCQSIYVRTFYHHLFQVMTFHFAKVFQFLRHVSDLVVYQCFFTLIPSIFAGIASNIEIHKLPSLVIVKWSITMDLNMSPHDYNWTKQVSRKERLRITGPYICILQTERQIIQIFSFFSVYMLAQTLTGTKQITEILLAKLIKQTKFVP